MIKIIPNMLTLIRLLLVPLFILVILEGKIHEALLVFFAAALTDALDGALARLLKAKTGFGKLLDPVADKLLIDSGFFVLSLKRLIPMWLTSLVIGRDVLIITGSSILLSIGKAKRIKPLTLGKISSFFQFFTVLAVLLIGKRTALLRVIFFTTAFFTAASFVAYTRKLVGDLNEGKIT